MSSRSLRVAVLMGGIGGEREVSLESGKYVAEALRQAGCSVITSDITPDDMSILDKADIDVFFIALHGKFGEDGSLQQVLEQRRLCYTGSGPKASRLAMDKMASKKLFAAAGTAVPKAVEYKPGVSIQDAADCMASYRGKLVVKPVTGGSTVGVTIEESPAEAIAAAARCYSEFGDAMIEQFVAGREVTVGVVHGKALPIIEIRPKSGFYDYNAKYIAEDTQYLFDTIEDKALAENIQGNAIRCFDSLGCLDFGRMDLILSSDGTAYALEINTIPGFTSHSLLPKAAAKSGISMPELCIGIIRSAMDRHFGLHKR
ncbi:MAG TPA: D-alanine--D-alanine ligase [Sedimentisphaerales bacterium]|nr:D-alanine--D-alanine ligase [Sedimentisphaerales bacterium]